MYHDRYAIANLRHKYFVITNMRTAVETVNTGTARCDIGGRAYLSPDPRKQARTDELAVTDML